MSIVRYVPPNENQSYTKNSQAGRPTLVIAAIEKSRVESEFTAIVAEPKIAETDR